MVQAQTTRRNHSSAGTHGKGIVEKAGMTAGLENFLFMRTLEGLDSKILQFSIDSTSIKGSTKPGAEENVYSVAIGSVNVTTRDPKAGEWYTNLSGKGVSAYLMPRQDDPTGSFFQKLATQRRNQAMHRAFAAIGFEGSVEVKAHSVSQGSLNGKPVLVIEADAVYGPNGERWSVLDFPYGEAMQEAIDSRRKPSDESEGSPEGEMQEALS